MISGKIFLLVLMLFADGQVITTATRMNSADECRERMVATRQTADRSPDVSDTYASCVIFHAPEEPT